MLESQLALIEKRDPDLARRIASATPAPVAWSAARSGALTGSLAENGATIALASRYDPVAEAGKLIDQLDIARHACIVVMGLGTAVHVRLLAERIQDRGVIVVYEPDTALLRAVLERVDCREWLGQGHIILADDQTDRATLIRQLEPASALITQGMALLTHPPTRRRRPEAIQRFGETMAQITAYLRTQVATAMVNAARTYSNLVMNLHHYAAGATMNDLHQAAAGYPAVCISAGPSLSRNVHLLTDPQVRSRVVVICAQTTLKPLLARGIRPDIVTALDYAPISQRFYEHLPPLPEVTLVAEPVAHPAILEHFPGPIRLTQSRFLDRLLGDRARTRVAVPYGGTVAHLSYYVAQHLGCDPIILLGQDLGFSDGLYYCPGTAIHDVWAPELGPFNTLEMMEWQRIARHRGHLQKREDIHGRPIFTDEQMLTYLGQFERDFAAAEATVLDCTEGGLPKAHATTMALAEALSQHAVRPVPPLPRPQGGLDTGRLRTAAETLHERYRQVRRLHLLSRGTLPLLNRMLDTGEESAEFHKAYAKVDANRRAVATLEDAFALVNEVNTVGVYKRYQTDRHLALSSDPDNRQRQQLHRDIDNVTWITEACGETLNIFEQGLHRLEAQLHAPAAREATTCPNQAQTPVAKAMTPSPMPLR